MNKNDTKFAQRLKALRGKATKTEAANGIGISRVALGYYEAGQRRPDITTLAKIAEYYNVSADFLIGLPASGRDATLDCAISMIEAADADITIKGTPDIEYLTRSHAVRLVAGCERMNL